MLNLLDNAAKWSPPGATVRVQMRPLDPWSVLLEVADAGPGIAEQDLPRVFDRFYRATGARDMPGSGLGLSIVRQVAVRHGGAVWAGRAPEGVRCSCCVCPAGRRTRRSPSWSDRVPRRPSASETGQTFTNECRRSSDSRKARSHRRWMAWQEAVTLRGQTG